MGEKNPVFLQTPAATQRAATVWSPSGTLAQMEPWSRGGGWGVPLAYTPFQWDV